MNTNLSHNGPKKLINYIQKASENFRKNAKQHELFGSGNNHPTIWWKELGQLLRHNGFLSETKSSFSQFGYLIQLTEKAEKWMQHDGKVIN